MKNITLGATFEPEYCEYDNDYHIYCQVLNFHNNDDNNEVLINNQHDNFEE